MSTLVTRSGKGSPLTHDEVDTNFTNLNTDKYQEGNTIGGTTPAAGSFTTLIGGADVANYGQFTGGATTKAVEFKSLGSDTNVAYAIRSKGTGAIDLAAGTSGVNISNGGTVTAITGTAGGSYTVVPLITISVPTTAGGVQATGTVGMSALTTALASGGTGYAIGDTITLTGGTFTQAIVLTVATLSGSAVATFTTNNAGTYSVLPTNPVAQGSTSGGGSGATFNVTAWQVRTTAFTITNAGSGYVEQPTITFTSGSAAAYASVGAGSVIRSLGSTGTQSLSFFTPSGELLRFRDTGTSGPYAILQNTSSGVSLFVSGSAANATLDFNSAGTSPITFGTNGNSGNQQFRLAHTASAVNYVQVTGAATGAGVAVSSQGTDSSIGLNFQSKGGSGTIGFGNTTSLGHQAFRIATGTAVNTGNLILVTGAAAGSAPSIAAISGTSGTDADIDLTLTPKGAGRVNITTSIKPKVNSTTSVASPLAWNSTSYDEYALTALANALTISADANTAPADGQRMMFRFKDNGTAQTLTWTTGSARAFRVVGVTLPTATVANKLLYVGCIYNAADSRWDVIAVGQEA